MQQSRDNPKHVDALQVRLSCACRNLPSMRNRCLQAWLPLVQGALMSPGGRASRNAKGLYGCAIKCSPLSALDQLQSWVLRPEQNIKQVLAMQVQKAISTVALAQGVVVVDQGNVHVLCAKPS